MKEFYSVIKRHISTEKANKVGENLNQYVFEVDGGANKIDIRNALESHYDIKNKVLKVTTSWVSGKFKRRGRLKGGYRSDWKKAYVMLVKGVKLRGLSEDS
jgi:large subunit ribosomal protein L23